MSPWTSRRRHHGCEDPKCRPSVLQKPMVHAGWLGGNGFSTFQPDHDPGYFYAEHGTRLVSCDEGRVLSALACLMRDFNTLARFLPPGIRHLRFDSRRRGRSDWASRYLYRCAGLAGSPQKRVGSGGDRPVRGRF